MTRQVMQVEPFGPLAVVNPVASLDEGIAQANSVPYGLAAYGFTNRADYVDRMIEGIEAGNVSINTLEASLPETPFGGVKSSGYGREGGTEGLAQLHDHEKYFAQPVDRLSGRHKSVGDPGTAFGDPGQFT